MQDKIELFQREANPAQPLQPNNVKEQLNTLQENLTLVQMQTVEDMPFSKFLVKISNSYYQTIGRFTKAFLTGGGQTRTPEVAITSKKQMS